MKDFFLIFGFLGILILFAVSNGAELGQNVSRSSSDISSSPTTIAAPTLTHAEKEERVSQIYNNLNSLKEELRTAELWGTPSPYRDRIQLSVGNVWGTEPDLEYLTLAYLSSDGAPLNISDWYIESVVTEERAGIPEGDRLIERWRSPVRSDIYFEPGEYAYLITRESPINTSFKENLCTGYLNDEMDFYPMLGERCPSPLTELKDDGRIDLDNDACYDFVEQMPYCEMPSDASLIEAPINRVCRDFIEKRFEYNSCVENHKDTPLFNRDGYWYIYFGRHEDLWRGEREIIRLIDESGRVVDVLEY